MSQQLHQAISAIKIGNKQAGQKLLRQLLETDPNNETVWLWLAAAVDSDSEKVYCLNKVLELNPDNNLARQSITLLDVISTESVTEPTTSSITLKRLKKHRHDEGIITSPIAATNFAALTWDEVWLSAISQPEAATFERILADPQATPKRAYRWLIFSSLIAASLGFLLELVVGLATQGIVNPTTLISLFVGVTVGPFIGVFAAAFNAALTQWVARGLGGQGTYSELIYVQAAYGAPLGIVIATLAAIPYINLLILPLLLYAFILDLIALRSVNRFGWETAIGAKLISGFIVGLVVGCGCGIFLTFSR